jgi:hypothetical protein
MLTCDRITGDWKEGLLVDSDELVSFDPTLNIEFVAGKYRGRFTDDHNAFEIDCREIGGSGKLEISFTRTHNDGKKTKYKGKVVDFDPRADVGIIKGTFDRETVRQGRPLRVSGDWETEKPT